MASILRFKLVLAILVLMSSWAHVRVEAAGGCQSILDASNQNTNYARKDDTGYQTSTSAASEDWSSYTYEQYTSDLKTEATRSRAVKFNAAAKVSIIGSGSGSASGSGSDETAAMDSYAFEQSKTKVASFRASRSQSASGTSGGTSSSETLSKWFDPSVFASYNACLDAKAKDIAISVALGQDFRSAMFDIKFTPSQTGATATFNGWQISPAGSATCTLTPSQTQTSFVMTPQVTYNIFCELTSTALKDGGYTTIFISNSAAPSLSQAIYRLPVDNTENLIAKVVNLQTEMGRLTNKFDELKASLRFNAATGTISPNRLCVGDKGLCLTNSVENTLLVKDRADSKTAVQISTNGDQGDRFIVYHNPAAPNSAGGFFVVNAEVFGAAKDGRFPTRIFAGKVCTRDVCIADGGPGALSIENWEGDRKIARFDALGGDKLQVYNNVQSPNVAGGFFVVNRDGAGVVRDGSKVAIMCPGKAYVSEMC